MPNSEYEPTLYETTYDSTYVDPYTYGGDAYTASPVASIISIAIAVLLIVSLWKVFTKAGKPGWAAIIPFYNIWVMLEVAGRPGWWLILYFIPLVNILIAIIVSLDIAKAFGKSGVFGFFGLFLFGFIGYPMLAFGNAKYTKPAAR
jgi:hypothetical protein